MPSDLRILLRLQQTSPAVSDLPVNWWLPEILLPTATISRQPHRDFYFIILWLRPAQSMEIACFGHIPAVSRTAFWYFSGWATSKSAFMYMPHIMKTSGQWLTQISQPVQRFLSMWIFISSLFLSYEYQPLPPPAGWGMNQEAYRS